MRRAILIPASLIALLLLLQPFDCFGGGGKFTRKALDCCKKGQCVPSSKADDCCKATLPGGKQLVTAKPSYFHSTSPLQLFATVNVPVMTYRAFLFANTPVEQAASPPGSPPGSRQTLPLLI